MRLTPLAVISLFIPFDAAKAQAPFEGVVSTRITVAGAPPMESVMHVKGTRGRSEMSIAGMRAYSIMDFDKGTIVAIMPAQKMFITQSMNDVMARVGTDTFARKFKGGAFLLKMDLREGGQTRMLLEVTKLEKKPVADSMFVMPEGYQDMSGMMKNLPGRVPPGTD